MDLTRHLPGRTGARAQAGKRPDGDPHTFRHRKRLANRIIGSPAMDAPLTWLVARVALPSSRLWAAAETAGGDPDKFSKAAPLPPLTPGKARRLRRHWRRLLGKIDAFRARSQAADAAWEAGFFGSAAVPESTLVDLEAQRAGASRALFLQRWRLIWTLLRTRVPAARYDVTAPETAAAHLADALADPGRAFALPAQFPPVERSRSIPGRVAGRDSWLRFAASPEAGAPTAWARVHEPAAVRDDTPTFIFTNGISAETDQLDAPTTELLEMVCRGIRVVEVEAPFHGRRRLHGQYSGEPYFAELPGGAINLFTALAKELGIIADWARRQSPHGRVAFGGVSLGAIVSQLAAAHAPAWPESARPDVLFLIVPAANVSELPETSRLAALMGLPEAALEAGHGAEDSARWSALTDPPAAAPLPPGDIIAVLGARDRVCPYAPTRARMDEWGLPPENLFVYRGGHFSTPFRMLWEGRAMDRLVSRLAA